MAAALELGLKKLLDDRARLIRRQAPTRQGQDVRVVVAPAHLGFLGIMGVHGPHTVDLVGDDRDPDAGPAYENTQVGLARRHLACGVGGVQRVVGRLFRVRADVHNLVAALLQERPYKLLELESGVIRSDCDPHTRDDSAGPGAGTLAAMTSSQVELLRDGFDRLAAEGYEAMVPLIHPEFEMETPAALAAEPQRYEGVDGFRRWWTSFLEVMDEVTLEAAGFHEIGPDQVAIETVMRAVGSSSGIETAQGVVMVVTLRDEKMLRIDFATSLEQAMSGDRA